MANEPESGQFVRPEVLSNFAGLTVRRIQQLTQEGIIKSAKPEAGGQGRVYDFLPNVRALLLHYREKADKKNAPSEAMDGERLRREAARRELDEIKLRTAKCELHYTTDIEKVFGSMLSRLRVGLLALPQGVAPVLVDHSDINEIAEIIADRLNRCLTELSSFDFETFAVNNGEYINSLDGEGNGDADESDD